MKKPPNNKPTSPLSKWKARSFFCVLNNVNHLFDKNDTFFDDPRFKEKVRQAVAAFRDKLDKDSYTPEEIVDYLINLWIGDYGVRRSCAINYEIGDNGTHHCHMVLEDKSQCRATAITKLFPTIHVDQTRGTKKDVTAYVEKTGKFEEKHHTVLVPAKFSGDIEGKQGKRNDLEDIQDMLEAGLAPEEIMMTNFSYRRYSKMIRDHYFQLRVEDTPPVREVTVYYHLGESGTGKSYVQAQLMETYGRNQVYVMTDYSTGGFDHYQGELILFLDEFKGNMPFSIFLSLLDKYTNQVHARYANTYALWDTVHIASLFTPESVYYAMVPNIERQRVEDIRQLYRRITYMVYHFKTDDGQYKQVTLETQDYLNYEGDIKDLCQSLHQQDPDTTEYFFKLTQRAVTSNDQEKSNDPN